jgi:acyl-CoA synthetase (AMP-forming)/AMP-acid ligase II
LIALAGAFKAGCIVSGVSPLLTPKELAYQLNDCQAKVLVVLDALFENSFMKIKEDVPALSHIVAANIGDYLPGVKRILGKALKKLPTGKVSPIPGKTITFFKDALRDASPLGASLKRDPQDTALLMYTGGTTGPSKGCEITNRTLVAETMSPEVALGLEKGSETVCSGFPFFHIAGMGLGDTCMASAYTQILVPDPRNTKYICQSMAKLKPTFVANVPTLYLMLMDEPEFKTLDMASSKDFKVCISGAAPFAPESFQALEKIVGKGKVLEAYGATETCSTFTANPLEGNKKLGSVGIPLPGNRIKILDLETGTREMPVGEEGEIVANGPKVMKGYLNKPEETANVLREFEGEKWLFTGDVGKLDEDGYLYIVDRTKDMILVGGYNVFSKMVEDTLYKHPAVDLCAVIGVPNPDRKGDERVKAFIQLVPEYKMKDPEELKKELDAFCRQELAPYKVPRLYEFTEGIPLTPVGKVDKKILR